MEKGGSDRKFYRLTARGKAPLIFVQYGTQKEENSHYVEIGAFLELAGVRVPKMFLHEPQEGRIWMEDLGELDLWTFRGQDWSVRRGLYESALREVYRLHRACKEHPVAAEGLGLQSPFDAALYQWEQDYFFKHCVSRHLGIDAGAVESARERLHAVALELQALPRCLVHRDFQSQNIVVRDGEPCLIDFQGMRYGLPQYDIASLLLDPYTELSADERGYLLEFYRHTLQGGVEKESAAEFTRVYQLCAAQRLMQALGAYGFLGHEKGRSHFLSHIPVALPRLVAVLRSVGGLGSLADLLEENAATKGLHSAPDAVKTAARPC